MWAAVDCSMETKLSNPISKNNRTFASVFLALSLFGFLFPHQTNQVKSNHQVNLRTSEQPANPRVYPGQPYNQGSGRIVLCDCDLDRNNSIPRLAHNLFSSHQN